MESNQSLKKQLYIKKMFILIGLPRSGKTTMREIILNRFFHIVPVSADDLRYEIYNQRYWQGGEDQVWLFRKHHLNSLMKYGITILIDETNTTKKRRDSLLKLCDFYGYTPIYIFVDTDKEICIERANKIDDKYIIPIIEHQSKQFEIPVFEEIKQFKFSVITHVDNCNFDSFDFSIFIQEFRAELKNYDLKK